MKIAYVFPRDATDPSVQSGRPHSILTEFERRGFAVERVFPLGAAPARLDLAKKAGYRLLGRFHRGDRSAAYLDALAGEFTRRVAGRGEFDFVFSPGSEAVSRLRTRWPIVFCADATFANLVDYYWDFTGLSQEYLRDGHAQEGAALANATLAVFPSEWAARAAIEHYRTDPAKVAVIPFGANLGRHNQRAAAEEWIARRPADNIRLLFVGRDWERKGGDLVISTAFYLQTHGHPVTVDVVGCDVPAQYHGVPWIVAHGLLHQCNPAHMARLNELYAQAHFVFVPSRAEGYGFTLTEACAFGSPPIATRTGGIPAIVRDGHNGLLLPLEATAADYADAIVATFSDQARYRGLCHQAFAEFEQRLNWPEFTRRLLAAFDVRRNATAAATPEANAALLRAADADAVRAAGAAHHAA
jgi:glycosyltransferase involved in cell wall biosynthesis